MKAAIRGMVWGVILAAIVFATWARQSPELNTSSDGRYHTCGLVTEHGVTENLDDYHRRCGGKVWEDGSVTP